MAGEAARSTQFDYKLNSNLVLSVDKNLIDRRAKSEATGEVITLYNRLSDVKMGDKAERTRPKKLQETNKVDTERYEKFDTNRFKGINVLNSEQQTNMDVGSGNNIIYRPKSNTTKQIYERLLNIVQNDLGHEPRDLLCATVDELLMVLKDDHLKLKEKRKELEDLLGKITDERFSLYVNAADKLNDWIPPNKFDDDLNDDNDESNDNDNLRKDVEYDTNVVFDDLDDGENETDVFIARGQQQNYVNDGAEEEMKEENEQELLLQQHILDEENRLKMLKKNRHKKKKKDENSMDVDDEEGDDNDKNNNDVDDDEDEDDDEMENSDGEEQNQRIIDFFQTDNDEDEENVRRDADGTKTEIRTLESSVKFPQQSTSFKLVSQSNVLKQKKGQKNELLNEEVEGEGEMEKKDKFYINPYEIDAFWLQRTLSKIFPDSVAAKEKTEEVLMILKESKNERELENQLALLIGFKHFQIVKLLRMNYKKVYYCTRLAASQTKDERLSIIEEMKMKNDLELEQLLTILLNPRKKKKIGVNGNEEMKKEKLKKKKIPSDENKDVSMKNKSSKHHMPKEWTPQQILDLQSLSFQQGSHLMSNKKCVLPEGSERERFKGYEEIHVPPLKAKEFGDKEKLRPISSLPKFAQIAFDSNIRQLNRIQSQVYKTAMETDENLLICAPTGAGKTNIALLTILREIGKHIQEDNTIEKNEFKMIYMAPMKSLVAELVESFSKKLSEYHLKVRELTGDSQMNREQIEDTDLIICTPEKWDIITRKSGERVYTQLVRLLIIDEIHLLHDMRGPVIESIVSRTIRNTEMTHEPVRIVGLSATLPNYYDVAAFLRTDPKVGLFFFDNCYRPVHLRQQFIGITEKKVIKRFQLMNEIIYKKVLLKAGKKQVLVFVHSRKETGKTCRSIRDQFVDNETLSVFGLDSATIDILKNASEEVKNQELKELLPYGMGIHHAGLLRHDRDIVEDLFRRRYIQLLISTATLAWGVNLPAHTVIIKGTQIYSAEKGRWVEMSSMDIFQMLGRAGRPQHDTEGEGIIITSHSELLYYLSLSNEQLPIESQLISKIIDMMNAEIVLGTIQTINEAADWLRYTYLYIRMLRNPSLYGIEENEAMNDQKLEQRRIDLVHTAAISLDKTNLIRYDRKSGQLHSTELGRIASHYYCTFETMTTYHQLLKPTLSEIELLRVFSLSSEFKQMHVRDEEKKELVELLSSVPIPIKESVDETSAKVNVLLQAYISQLKLEGFALMSDMIFISQSSQRLLRAIFEIVLIRGWAQLADKTLNLCKMVERRMWQALSPLRQFQKIPKTIIEQLENTNLSWNRFFDLRPKDFGDIIKNSRLSKSIHRYVHQIPKVELTVRVLPVTRGTLRVDLTIHPNFIWDNDIHGLSIGFWIFVEDVDSEVILHHQYFLLKRKYCTEDHSLTFHVPVFEPMPPQYFIRVCSDRWITMDKQLPISFRHLTLPEKHAPPTELLDLQSLQINSLQNEEFEKLYENEIDEFNAIQTQTFNSLYMKDDNIFIGAPSGSGKTICAEFAMLRLFSRNANGKCVYVCPKEEICSAIFRRWEKIFGGILKKNVYRLCGETGADLKLLARGNIIISLPTHWDVLSRRWKKRRHVQNVSLLIIDELHLMNSEMGAILEVISSRMRYINAETELKIRIVALSAPLANARDIYQWLACPSHSTFNFHLSVRPIQRELHIQSFNISHNQSRLVAMIRPCFNSIMKYSMKKSTIIFVPSRKQSCLTAIDLVTFIATKTDLSVNVGGKSNNPFVHCNGNELKEICSKLDDDYLGGTISQGVAYLHESLSDNDRSIVMELFRADAIGILVVSYSLTWSLNNLHSYLVIILDTQYYNGELHSYEDYELNDILHQIGRATIPSENETHAILLCQTSRKEYYHKFLYEPLPIESFLHHSLHDHFNSEIVTEAIENKQDAVDYLTWTFLYSRLRQNPNYYGLTKISQRHISDYLSELVETTLSKLQTSKCIAIVDELNVQPLNLGIISAYYYINYQTMELLSVSLSTKTKVRGLLEIIANANEFSFIPLRQGEVTMMKKLNERVPYPISTNDSFHDIHVKVYLLFQAYLSRFQLPSIELQLDINHILPIAIRLLQACVDVLGTNEWLNPALAAMELSQCLTQALQIKDSPLKQIPHFNIDLIKRCHEKNIRNVTDLFDLEDDERKDLLKMKLNELNDVAKFCNRYPNIDVSILINGIPVDLHDDDDDEDEEDEDEDDVKMKNEEKKNKHKVKCASEVNVTVNLEREDETSAPVIAAHFPEKRDEGWWLVIGQSTSNSLYSIRRTTLNEKSKIELKFIAPNTVGEHEYHLFLMSDSYVGCDQEYEFSINTHHAI
ncbi:hypothetical protein SNEBB_003991 [Seison nebaliae]|nr:hypothetical protein SNEBB_003991 [Seison nebaliae]